jgi:hypothetical protein
MNGAPYYTVRQKFSGTWAVVHLIPGLGIPSIDCECPTREAAQEAADDMNREREAQQQKLLQVRRLCGVQR